MEFIEGVDALISMLSTKNNVYAKASEHYPPVFTITNFVGINEKMFANLPLAERQEKVLDLLRDKFLNNYEISGDKRFSIRSLNSLIPLKRGDMIIRFDSKDIILNKTILTIYVSKMKDYSHYKMTNVEVSEIIGRTGELLKKPRLFDVFTFEFKSFNDFMNAVKEADSEKYDMLLTLFIMIVGSDIPAFSNLEKRD